MTLRIPLDHYSQRKFIQEESGSEIWFKRNTRWAPGPSRYFRQADDFCKMQVKIVLKISLQAFFFRNFDRVSGTFLEIPPEMPPRTSPRISHKTLSIFFKLVSLVILFEFYPEVILDLFQHFFKIRTIIFGIFFFFDKLPAFLNSDQFHLECFSGIRLNFFPEFFMEFLHA